MSQVSLPSNSIYNENYGARMSCPSTSAVKGFCGSLKNDFCNNKSTALLCGESTGRVDVSSDVQTKDIIKTESNSPNVFCDVGYNITGVCLGNNKICGNVKQDGTIDNNKVGEIYCQKNANLSATDTIEVPVVNSMGGVGTCPDGYVATGLCKGENTSLCEGKFSGGLAGNILYCTKESSTPTVAVVDNNASRKIVESDKNSVSLSTNEFLEDFYRWLFSCSDSELVSRLQMVVITVYQGAGFVSSAQNLNNIQPTSSTPTVIFDFSRKMNIAECYLTYSQKPSNSVLGSVIVPVASQNTPIDPNGKYSLFRLNYNKNSFVLYNGTTLSYPVELSVNFDKLYSGGLQDLFNKFLESSYGGPYRFVCCNRKIGFDLYKTFCSESDYYADWSGTSSKCDTFMENFCKDNPTNKSCVCFPSYPITGTGYDELIAKNEPSIPRECVLQSCMEGQGYKTSNMRNRKCAAICANVANIEAAEYAKVNLANVSLKCGESGISFSAKTEGGSSGETTGTGSGGNTEESTSTPTGEIPESPSNSSPDIDWKFIIGITGGVIGFILLIILVWFLAKPKKQ